MTDEANYLSDLESSMAVLERHFKRAKTNAEAEGSELTELECAIGNVVQLVPLMLEDYALSWDLAQVMRDRIKELEAQVTGNVAKVLRSPGGIVLPT